MQALKFIHSNYLYIIWFIIYFTLAWILLGAGIESLIIVTAVYGVSMTIALCPVGEIILRLLENCREPQTEQERNYLLPMFEEVYQYALEANPKLNKGIKIYIMDAMFVNAFAIGRKTIAVTRGALETFTAEELKGILAHELGHMTYGHTKALLLSLIGNLFFSAIVWFFRLLLNIFQTISNISAVFNVVGIIFAFILFIMRFFAELCNFIFVNLGQMLLALNSRQNEIQADTFAYDIGYGRELTASLYLLQKTTINTKIKLSERMKASHPHMGYRIAHLEKLESEGVA